MKLRKLATTVGLSSLLVANTALGLGLGEFKLNSSLNEPFDAEIPLLKVGDLNELEMLVGLGSKQHFANAGVDREFFLTGLNFKVDLSDSANPVIRISSQKAVREPYLDFLVDLQWPTGRLLREYTVLMDLPVFTAEKSSAKKIEAASTGSQPRPRPRTESSRTSSAVASGENYTVESGDNLWGIAKQIKPSDASIHQTMVAIQQLNPSAFINSNINLLKKGAVLRLPEGTEIDALSHAEAVAVVSQQNSSLETDQPASAPQLDASPADTTSTGTTENRGGQLKLAAIDASVADINGDFSSTSAGLSSVSGSGNDEAFQNDLVVVQEELARTSRENTELRDRLSNLEEQITTMRRLVELNDDTLRAAQVASAQAETTGVAPEDAVAGSEAVAAAAAVSETATATPEPQPASSQASSNSGSWLDNLLYPAAALLAILLAFFMFFRNRNQDDDEEFAFDAAELGREEPQVVGLAALEPETPASPTDDTLEVGEILADIDTDELEEEDLSALELAAHEDVDPLGEADIYLSLGNHDQAEAVLKDALKHHPDNSNIHLKLLEVYVTTGDLAQFDVQQRELASLNNPLADSKAQALRTELAGEQPEVAEVENSAAEDDSLEQVELVLPEAPDVTEQDKAIEDDQSVEETPASETDTDSVSDLEFDLDLDLDDVDIESLFSDLEDTAAEAPEVESTGSETSDDLSFMDKLVEEDQADDELQLAEPEADDIELEPVLAEDSKASDSDEFDGDLDILGDADESGTKIDLAEAYIEMGDADGAKDILNEVMDDGTDEQKEKARSMLESLA